MFLSAYINQVFKTAWGCNKGKKSKSRQNRIKSQDTNSQVCCWWIFDKGIECINWWKKKVPSKKGFERIVRYVFKKKRNYADLFVIPYKKIGQSVLMISRLGN